MTSLPQPDPLIGLWQTAPRPDTQHLLRDLQRLDRLHRRLNRSLLAILAGTSLLLLFEEAVGGLSTHGALSALWIAFLAVGITWQRRARRNGLDAFSLNTIDLLKSMIGRAKRDLFLARCLYAGVPCGAVAGYFLANLAGIGTRSSSIAIHSDLHPIETAAGIAVLLGMVATGAILARSRSIQVQALREKLRLIQSDL